MSNAKDKMIAENLGCLVWLDFESISVSPQAVTAALASHGMSEVSVPALDVGQQIRGCTYEFRPTGFPRGRSWKAEVVGSYPDGTIEIGLLQHVQLSTNRNAAKKVEWSQDDSVVYDTKGGCWMYTGTTEAARQFIALANQRIGLIGAGFVREEIVFGPLKAAGAFPLRRRIGTFYFAPKAAIPKAEQIAAVVRDLPCDAHVYIAHIQASEHGSESVGTAAREHVGGLLGELKERIAAWKQSTRQVRTDALQATLEEFAVLRDHAELYRDSLGILLDDFTADIETAIAQAREIAGLSERGVPPGTLDMIRAFVADRGYGVEIPWTAFADTALPAEATGPEWWRGARVRAAMDEAGIEGVISEAGITLYAAGTAPAAEPRRKPAPAQDDPRAAVRGLTDAQIMRALEVLAVGQPADSSRATLEAAYFEAVGL